MRNLGLALSGFSPHNFRWPFSYRSLFIRQTHITFWKPYALFTAQRPSSFTLLSISSAWDEALTLSQIYAILPPFSIRKVVLRATKGSNFHLAPYRLTIFLLLSLSNGKLSENLSLNFSWDFTPSVLTPRTCTPRDASSSSALRSEQASIIQPVVLSLG